MNLIQVTAAIIEKDANILICQRHNSDSMPLKWEFPGGKIEDGESGKSCLKRELKEELSVEAKIGELIIDYIFEYNNYDKRVHLFFYHVDDFTGRIRNNVFQQIRWVSRHELAAYDFLEADIKIVRQLYRFDL